jgi:hypothetical protein
VHAFVGWVLCAATMGLGIMLTTLENTLYIHAAMAPVFFFALSLNYFKKYNHFSPIKTAIVFVSFVLFIDFFIVALLINRNLEMFSSILGTWIPFMLICTSTYITGTIVNIKKM